MHIIMKSLYYRSFLSGNTPPLGPSSSRIVEAVFILLCQNHPEDSRTSSAGMLESNFDNNKIVNRWPEETIPV